MNGFIFFMLSFCVAMVTATVNSYAAEDPCGSTLNDRMILVTLNDGSRWCMDQFQNVVCDSSLTGRNFFRSCISRMNNDRLHGKYPNGLEKDEILAANPPGWADTLRNSIGLTEDQKNQVVSMFASHNQTSNALPEVITTKGSIKKENYRAFSISPLDQRIVSPGSTLALPLETRYITPAQAKTLCERNGKVIPPEAVWRAAAKGSPICQSWMGTDHCVAPSGAWNMLGHIWEIVISSSPGAPSIVKGNPSFDRQVDPLDVFSDFGSETFAIAVSFRCAKQILKP